MYGKVLLLTSSDTLNLYSTEWRALYGHNDTYSSPHLKRSSPSYRNLLHIHTQVRLTLDMSLTLLLHRQHSECWKKNDYANIRWHCRIEPIVLACQHGFMWLCVWMKKHACEQLWLSICITGLTREKNKVYLGTLQHFKDYFIKISQEHHLFD